MGLLDNGSGAARPCGMADGPRQDYVPPRTLRRGDFAPPKESLRDRVLGVLRDSPMGWVALCDQCQNPKQRGLADLSATLTQLVSERIVRINHRGEYVYVEIQNRSKAAAVPEKKPDAVSAPSDKDLQAMLVLMAQRALDAEEHFQKALDSLLVEIESERAMRKTLQDAFFEQVGKAV